MSIGLPVYNGEKYIKQAIDSILIQTFSNFEIIISDNASTDNTEVICREYVEKDNRIKYFRHEKNKGASFNFPFVLLKAKSDYFVWIGADDYWEQTFLEKNVSILNSNQNIVGSIGLVEFYGIKDWHIKKNLTFKIKNIIRQGSNKDHQKYVHVRPAFGTYKKKAEAFLRFNQASFFYGLFRTIKLQNRSVSATRGWDLMVILNILKDGDLHVVDEVLVHRFVSGTNSNDSFISLYRNKRIVFRELILPGSTLFLWCLKNIGIQFILKNFDWFLLLVIHGWFTIIQEIKMKKWKN